MGITATELKNNLSKYLMLVEEEDIYITKNGKVIAKLTSPFKEKVDLVKELFDSIPDNISLEEAQEERLSKI